MIMLNERRGFAVRAGALGGYSIVGIILIALAVIGLLYLFGRA